jgi:hypothetical protein
MKKLITCVTLIYASFSFAQKQVDVSLELLDGNMIKGTSVMNDVELITAYGKLQIPIAKVSHIDVGIGKDPAVSEKANSSLKLLATNPNEATRKLAYTDLVKMGIKAIPAIQDFYNDSKNSTEENQTSDYTIENALTEIKSVNNIGDDAPDEDVVLIDNNYIIGGIYNFVKMEIRTDYGNLSIPKEKIKSIDVSLPFEAGAGEYALKLIASKHISGNTAGGWLKTGISLKVGQRFSITANGEVSLASLSNTKYKPDGSSKAESATEFTKVYGAEEEGTSTTTYPSYGQVVYKIGESSTENIKAGAKYKGIAKSSGMLLISIYETVYNAANKGSYSVKISLGK